MKLLKKIIVSFMVFIVFLNNLVSLANVIDIGDSSIIERGEMGYYIVQYWNENRGQWMYLTYSRTYYKNKNGERKIAYCVDPELEGVGWIPGEYESYYATIEKKLEDQRLWRIYKNGYPNKTAEELGVETDDDAYLATKQAAYCIIRNMSQEFVRTFYRAGEDPIADQDMEATYRKGKKVVDLINRLVDIGYNGNETYSESKIVKTGDFVQDSNKDYYSLTYKISSTYQTTYNIKAIDTNLQGVFISDLKGNKKDSFNSNESFKIMVPKSNIKEKEYNIKIDYEENVNNYPVYYAKSQLDGKQNYVILDKNEIKEGSIEFKVYGNKSNLNILKIDEETGKPLEGVKFEVRRENGEKIGTYTTDKNGKISIINILQGNVIVKEIETNKEYVLNDEVHNIKLEYDSTYNLTIRNLKKKGNLIIEKIDKESKGPLENVVFEIIDQDGNKVREVTTNEEGKAIAQNLNIGKYIVKEIKGQEGYIVSGDKEIEIKYEETLNIKVENEKMKGNIQVLKIDKDNEVITLSGVEFTVFNENNVEVGKITTNEEGIGRLENIPIGKYFIKETKTKDGYVLDENIREIIVNYNEDSKLVLTNEKEKGKIKIIKTAEEDNYNNNKKAGDLIQNARFGIYDISENLVQEVVTNEKGEAISKKLDRGTYIVKELEPGDYYKLNEESFKAVIDGNSKVVELFIKNKSEKPNLDIKKTGNKEVSVNQEIKYEFEIKNTGDTDLSRFVWYDLLPYEYARITKISTGTYNQDLIYNIFYKTNKKDEYVLLRANLSTKENNYIDLSKIELDFNEEIIEIKVDFGDVKVGFENIEKPNIFVKANSNLENGTLIRNETILEGYNKYYKLTDTDDTQTEVIKPPLETKKLPRTGY